VKLVYAIVSDEDSTHLISEMNKAGHRVTKLASSGGFLRSGNSTLMIGTDDEKLEDVLNIIRKFSSSRKVSINANTMPSGMGGSFIPYPVEVLVGGATVFVVNVEHFEQV
jgi:uncharacterized protein YaaQ